MNPPIHRPTMLDTVAMGKRYNVSRQTISRLCRAGLIFPAQQIGGRWMVPLLHTIDMPSIELARTAQGGRLMPTPGRLGRPPGAKNLKPYPKGVKRPRKQP